MHKRESGFIAVVLIGLMAVAAGGLIVLDRIENRQNAAKRDQLGDGGRHENMSALAIVSSALATMEYTTPPTQVAAVGAPSTVPQFTRSAWIDPATLKLSLDPTATPSAFWTLDTAKNQFLVSLDDPNQGPNSASAAKAKVVVEPVPGSVEVETLENGITRVSSVVFQATSQVPVAKTNTTRSIVNKARVNFENPTDPSCWVEVLNQPAPFFQIGQTVNARVVGKHGFFGFAQMTPQGATSIPTMNLDDPAQLDAMANAAQHTIGSNVGFLAPPPPDQTTYPFPPYYWYAKGGTFLMQFYYQGLLPVAAQQGFQQLTLTATATLAAHSGTGVAANTVIQCKPATFATNVHYNPPKPCGCDPGYTMIKQINDSCVCQFTYPMAGGTMIKLRAKAEPLLLTQEVGSRLVGCFAEGTRIRMADGQDRPIETLTQADLVLDPVTQQQVEIKRLIKGPEKKPMIEVVDKAGARVMVTDGHPFLTPRGLVAARDLKLSDGYSRIAPVLGDQPVTVWNLELDTASATAEDHMVLANGVTTGDLYLQERLAERRFAGP